MEEKRHKPSRHQAQKIAVAARAAAVTMRVTQSNRRRVTSSRCQFHQFFTSRIFAQKCFAQLLCAYN